MRNTHIALLTIAGSLLVPALVFWGMLDDPAAGLVDVERHPVVAPVSLRHATADPTTATAPEPVRAAQPLTPAEQELVEWATTRFALVGLELPEVDISFHDDHEPCGGNPGRFRGGSQHRLVAVCVPDRGTFASHLERQRTLVHELAHAWDHANLDPSDRSELLQILDAHDWYAPESDWEERGVERFAETIVWGLYDQLRRPTLIDVTCRELHADFISITGSTAPGPLEPTCDPTSDTQLQRAHLEPHPQPSRTET